MHVISRMRVHRHTPARKREGFFFRYAGVLFEECKHFTAATDDVYGVMAQSEQHPTDRLEPFASPTTIHLFESRKSLGFSFENSFDSYIRFC